MKYAYVHESKVLRAFDELPKSWGWDDNLDQADEAKLESIGIFKIIDQRPVLPIGHNYDQHQFLFSNGKVYWIAVVTPPNPITQDQLDLDVVRKDSKLKTLSEMTPAQVKTWIANNVNTLADAKDLLSTLAIAVSILARRL